MTRRSIALVAMLCLFTIPLASAARSEPRTLDVMTYNIRSGAGTKTTNILGVKFFFGKGNKYLDQIADTAKSVGADVICLQEVQARCLRSLGQDQTRRIAEKVGDFYSVFEVAEVKAKVVSRQGDAILSRYPILEHERIVLNADDDGETRIAILARIAFPPDSEKGTWIVCTHLDHRKDETRAFQLARLATHLKDLEGPLVVAGDLNLDRDNPIMTQVYEGQLGRSLHNSLEGIEGSAGCTIPPSEPRRQIDFVLHDENFELLSSRVLREARGESDHLPVLARLSLVEEQGKALGEAESEDPDSFDLQFR